MSHEPDDIKRWTARRKAAAVMDIIKGKTTAAELARTHDLTVTAAVHIRHRSAHYDGYE